MTNGEGDGPKAPLPQTIKKLCMGLQSGDKKVRKQTLVDLQGLLKVEELSDEELHEIFKEAHIYVLNVLRDQSEPVREQGIAFHRFLYVEALPVNDFYLSYLFPVLVERLGSQEIIEDSEEIRLQLVRLLHEIIKRYSAEAKLKPFLNDCVIILAETVQDKYPSLKEESCKCIVTLAHALPRDFHMQAMSLVKPVLTAFGHQRFKIRCEAIKCAGEIVLHCEYKALDEVVGPMAERLFDQIPIVRRTVAQIAARWMREYRDRYSFWHKLLPLILTGLNDEVEETRTEAHQLWLAVGLQYEKENEKDLKDQLDFLTKLPEHYPENLNRPNLGCRVLVQRSVGKLAGALAAELVSWQPDIRVRCSQLLCSVAHHAEEGLTQHLQQLLTAMYSAARDEDNRVVENVIRASELMAVFVPADVWTKLILPVIENGAHYGHLAVLAAFIKGTPNDNVISSLREITQLLADKDICQSRKSKYQKELINCVGSVLAKHSNEGSDDVGMFLFIIVVTVLSIKAPDDDFVDEGLLEKLLETVGFETKYEMWSKYVGGLFPIINKDAKAWHEYTPDRCIFQMILMQSGEAFGEHLGEIGDLLTQSLDKDINPEARLKTFEALSNALENKDVIFKNAGTDLKPFLETLVTHVLVPALVWHAGRTAEAMRTAAASCLASALVPGDELTLFNDEETLRAIYERLLPLLISLCEDASYRSRCLAMENLVLLKDNLVLKSDWRVDDVIKIYPEILKRFDDPTDKCRLFAVKALGALMEKSPDDFKRETYNAHHEYLMDTLLVHFDDNEEEASLKDRLKGIIETMGEINKKTCVSKINKHKPLLRNQAGCDELLKLLTLD